MIGLLLTALGSLAHETSTAIGKWEEAHRKESIYAVGFLASVGGFLSFLALSFFVPPNFFAPGFPQGFHFDPRSLPTIIPKLLLDVSIAWAGAMALARADRSTFGFLHVITIPLLLIIDAQLGYALSTHQLTGILLIVGSVLVLWVNHGIRHRGAWLVVFISIGAAATISLFKYNITHFNSVEAEQLIAYSVLLVFFYTMARMRAKESPFRLLLRPVFFAQAFLAGTAGILVSFAYLFSTASIITAAHRGFDILLAILSGRLYFHEKKLWIKFICFAMILGGLLLLI